MLKLTAQIEANERKKRAFEERKTPECDDDDVFFECAPTSADLQDARLIAQSLSSQLIETEQSGPFAETARVDLRR